MFLKTAAALAQAFLLLGSVFDGVGVGVVRADNPIVQTLYSTDPAPIVHNGRLYVLTGHDEDGSTGFNMRDWRLYSTEDVANWQDHGVVASLATFSWANANAWAGQIIARNNKFYMYVPIRRTTGSMAIGVAVADTITGPYKDALGKPLADTNEIDPTVWIDDDGQAYLYWGNPNLWYVKLNADMISFSGQPIKVSLTAAGFGQRNGNAQRPTMYEEGPWLYKRNSLYYMIYAANCCSEDIRYATGPSATGPWTYRGLIMATEGKSFTNHAGVIEYKNQPYFFYHNGALPGGSGYTRSVSVERFNYNADGTIPQLRMSTAGPPQVGTLNPYVRQEAETMAFSSGLKTEVCNEGGMAVSFINNNDYIKVKGVAFGTTGAKGFTARVASNASGGKIEIRLGSTSGTLVGTCNVAGTGGWQTYTTVTCAVSGATGTQDVFFRFTGSGSDSLFNFNWWQFSTDGSTAPPPVASSTSVPQPPASSSSAPPPTQPTNNPTCAAMWGQCGGEGWSGPTCCSAGTCKSSNQWYSQCV
jgi:arabinoxylan arabinofuranohydrolase